jgi:hypothetical protein
LENLDLVVAKVKKTISRLSRPRPNILKKEKNIPSSQDENSTFVHKSIPITSARNIFEF